MGFRTFPNPNVNVDAVPHAKKHRKGKEDDLILVEFEKDIQLGHLGIRRHDDLTDIEPDDHHPWAHDHTGEIINPEEINIGAINFKYGWRLYETPDGLYILKIPDRRIFRMSMEEVKKGNEYSND